MNKLMKMVVVSCALAGLSLTVQAQYSGSAEFMEMEKWLFSTYTNGINENDKDEYYRQKEAYYAFLSGIQAKIKQEFPVDPALQKQVDDMRTAYVAARTKKINDAGFANEQAMYEAYIKQYQDKQVVYDLPIYKEINTMGQELNTATENAMKAHNEEFSKRFEAAFVEAVKKFQENAATMK